MLWRNEVVGIEVVDLEHWLLLLERYLLWRDELLLLDISAIANELLGLVDVGLIVELLLAEVGVRVVYLLVVHVVHPTRLVHSHHLLLLVHHALKHLLLVCLLVGKVLKENTLLRLLLNYLLLVL